LYLNLGVTVYYPAIEDFDRCNFSTMVIDPPVPTTIRANHIVHAVLNSLLGLSSSFTFAAKPMLVQRRHTIGSTGAREALFTGAKN
jgi:hypothetical protein